jgi:hypothetical protein
MQKPRDKLIVRLQAHNKLIARFLSRSDLADCIPHFFVQFILSPSLPLTHTHREREWKGVFLATAEEQQVLGGTSFITKMLARSANVCLLGSWHRVLQLSSLPAFTASCHFNEMEK